MFLNFIQSVFAINTAFGAHSSIRADEMLQFTVLVANEIKNKYAKWTELFAAQAHAWNDTRLDSLRFVRKKIMLALHRANRNKLRIAERKWHKKWIILESDWLINKQLSSSLFCGFHVNRIWLIVCVCVCVPFIDRAWLVAVNHARNGNYFYFYLIWFHPSVWLIIKFSIKQLLHRFSEEYSF